MWPVPLLNFPTSRNFWVLTIKVTCFFLYSSLIEYFAYSITQYLLRSPEVKDDNEVIFFTDKCNGCWSHICNKTPCRDKCAYTNIRKIVRYMEEAKESLDVCIYTITSYDFAYGILDAHKRGLKVRVITDNNRVKGCGSQIHLFQELGISVYSKSSTYEMHHKFFVVDNAILVNGSFNWTMQAFTGNWENAIICKDPTIVDVFVQHFNDLWEEFVPQESIM